MALPVMPENENCCSHEMQDEVSMTGEQRLCLQHVLRNTAMGLEGALSLVNNEEFHLTTGALAAVLRGLSQNLTRCVDYLDAGTFCPITPEECTYVSRFVGCNKVNTCSLEETSAGIEKAAD